MKKHELLENERICEDCGCSNLPFDVTKENYELVKQVVEVQNKVWAQLTNKQKIGWYMNGTIGFTCNIVDILSMTNDELNEKELEYCNECLTYEEEEYLWELAKKEPIQVPNDIHQMYDIIRLVWKLLTFEQKINVYENGTLPFVDLVLQSIGHNVVDYNNLVEVVYNLENKDLELYYELVKIKQYIDRYIETESKDIHSDMLFIQYKLKNLVSSITKKPRE